mmetsp:Transcript_30338/g.54946  ORF Transcript_30338/g.54946 Transcript_30338/m.54946 type:complete len:499 (-) Transcript_30338:137-1633(-)
MARFLLVGLTGRRHLSSSLLFASFLLTLFSVSALSLLTPPIKGRSIHVVSTSRLSSTLFPAPSTTTHRRSRALVTTTLAATDYRSKSSGGRLQLAFHSPKKLALRALSKISRHVTKLRRSTLRTMAILSFLLFGMRSMTAPAHAAWGKSNTVVPVVIVPTVTTPSTATKCIKVIVTAGAVVAGAATASKMRTLFDNNDDEDKSSSSPQVREDDILNVVPKDKPSPLPLSTAEKEKPPPAAANRPKKTTPAAMDKKDSTLVKDLDSKIEMLRAREELAKADAETKRLQDLEKAQEVRKQDQGEIDAKIAAAEKVHQRQKLVEQQRREEREQQLGKLEKGKKEQQRLEQQKADSEKKRLQDLEKAQEAVKQDQIEIDAKIAAVEKVQRDQERKLVEQQRQEREQQLGELEQGKKEQQIMEKDPPKSKDDTVVNGDVDIEQVRQQPKPSEEEQKLKEKYGSMDLEERAFNILVDLGMVDLHSDPDASLDWEENDDESNAFM